MTMMAIEYIFVVGVCLISLFWQCHPSSIITLSIAAAAAALKSMANKSSSFVEVPIIKLMDKANVALRPYEY